MCFRSLTHVHASLHDDRQASESVQCECSGSSETTASTLGNGPVISPPLASLAADLDRPQTAPAAVPSDDYVMVASPLAASLAAPSTSQNGRIQPHEASRLAPRSTANGSDVQHGSDSISHSGPADAIVEDGVQEEQFDDLERLLSQVS